MSENREHSIELDEKDLNFIQRNLADFLTLSRVFIGLTALALSLVGKSAYLAVVRLALLGGATDIFDGKVARHYFGENSESRLGKYDADIDTFFLLCVMAYFSLTGVYNYRVVGLGWVGLVIIAALLTRRNLKVLIVSEIVTVISLLIITLLYDLQIFLTVIVPVFALGLIINRKRVLYLVFSYWPSLYSRHGRN